MMGETLARGRPRERRRRKTYSHSNSYSYITYRVELRVLFVSAAEPTQTVTSNVVAVVDVDVTASSLPLPASPPPPPATYASSQPIATDCKRTSPLARESLFTLPSKPNEIKKTFDASQKSLTLRRFTKRKQQCNFTRTSGGRGV